MRDRGAALFLGLLLAGGCQHELDVIGRPCTSAADCPDAVCGPHGRCVVARDGLADLPATDAADASAPDRGADLARPDLPAPDQAKPDLPTPDLPPPDLPAPDQLAMDAAVPDALQSDAAAPVAYKLPGICSKAGWCWQNPIPMGSVFTGVWGSGPTDVWAATKSTVLRFDGAKLAYVDVPAGGLLYDIWGGSPSAVFLAGVSGAKIYDGKTWTTKNLTYPSIVFFYKVWGAAPTDVLLVGAAGNLRHLKGKTWTKEVSGLSDNLHGIWGASATEYHVVGDKGSAARYDGKAWTPMNTGTTKDLRAVWGRGPSQVYAFGYDGTALRFDGSKWNPEKLPGVSAHLLDAWGGQGSELYVVGDKGTILRHDGKAWNTMASNTTQQLADVWGLGPSEIYATGANGTVLRFDGAVWDNLSTLASTGDLVTVWGFSSTDVFAAGNYVMLHYDGKEWTARPKFSSYPPLALWGFSATDLYAIDSQGYFGRFDGTKWTYITSCPKLKWPNSRLLGLWGMGSGTTREVYTLNGDTLLTYYPAIGVCKDSPLPAPAGGSMRTLWGSGGELFAGGIKGTVLRRDTSGKWAAMKTNATGTVRHIFGTGPKDLWAVGDKVIAHYTGYWSNTASTANYTDGWTHGTGEVYLVSQYGVLALKSGPKWVEVVRGQPALEFNAIWGTSATDIFLVGAGGAILHKGP